MSNWKPQNKNFTPQKQRGLTSKDVRGVQHVQPKSELASHQQGKYFGTAVAIPVHGTIDALQFGLILDFARWAFINSVEIISIANKVHADARNACATFGRGGMMPDALSQGGFDQLIFIDSDQRFELQQLEELINHPGDFVTGWYMKGMPPNFAPMLFDWNDNYYRDTGEMATVDVERIERHSQMRKPFEVDYCGFGFTKVRTKILDQMEYPFFRHNIHSFEATNEFPAFKENLSEDASFCINAYKELGIKPLVLPWLRVGHLKPQVI